MLHVVFGAGLIGSFVGAALVNQHCKVKFVARGVWKERLQRPLLLTDFQGNKEAVTLTGSMYDSHENADIVWLTTKCTAIKSCIDDLQQIVQQNTVIICCQNGVGTHNELTRLFPHNPVIRAMVPFNVIFSAPNNLHKGSEGALTIESLPHDHKQIEKAILSCDQPLMRLSVTQDMDALQWAKLQLNLGNCVNALADIPVKAMLEQRDYRRVIAMAMDELLIVVRHKGICLPKVAKVHGRFLPIILRLPDWLFKRVATQMLAIDENVKTSMWWDLQAGKPTEIDYLNGAIVDAAREYGLPCPVNLFLINEVRQVQKCFPNIKDFSGIAGEELLKKLINKVKKDSSGKSKTED